MTLSRRRFVHLLGAGSAGALLTPTVSARGLEALAGARSSAPASDARGGSDRPVRLDSNENPYGPSRAALDAAVAALGEANRYPDDAAGALREAVAAVHGATAEHVVLGCGSTDVLRAAVAAWTSPARPLVTAAPTFESAAADAALLGVPVRAVPVGGDLRLDLAGMARAARGAGLVYVCNPNNPTATVHGGDAVRDFVGRVLRETPTATVLVDEAYHEYVDDPRYASMLPLALERPRVVVARTFSKVYGMAGLRVGYAVAHPESARALAARVLPIGVNQLGAAAALASLRAPGHAEAERARNREAREFTRRALTDLGYAPAPSDANFVMVDVRRDVRRFRDACRAEGVLVGRPFPPLATHARISLGTMDEMRRAADVFRRVLATA